MSDSCPIVMISSYPPRLCGIGTFTEEARELSKGQPGKGTIGNKSYGRPRGRRISHY